MDEEHPDAPELEENIDQLDALDEASRLRPLSVHKIYIAGLDRTRPAIIQQEFQGVQEARNIDEIRHALESVEAALHDLDIFDDVLVSIEPNREGDPEKCDVVVRCKERNRLHIKGGTYVQSNEGTVELQATLRNALGFAENVAFSCERSSTGSNEFSVTLAKPRPLSEPLVADVRVSQLFRNFQPNSSFTERTRGASIGLSTDDLRHSVAYELGWRTTTDPSRRASKAVQHHFGHALKSAVVYTFRHSVWQGPSIAAGGAAFRSTTELAGLGLGNAVLRFAKQRLQGFMTVPLPDTRAYFSMTGEVGVMVPLGAGWQQRNTPISDRFFLGGAGSLRGFHANSVGPTDARRKASTAVEADGEGAAHRNDFVGGDLFAAVSAAFNFGLPFEGLDAVGIRGHVFLNAGNTAQLTGARHNVRDSVHRFFSDFRLSTGVGVVWPISQVGNLEINVCKILRMQPTDRPKYGVQLGFSPQVL